MVLEINFFGTRGSRPVSGGPFDYGRDTSCVGVRESTSSKWTILDLGSGLNNFAESLDGPVEADLLLSHYHFDHLQGLPFFYPMDRVGSKVRLFAPNIGGDPLGQLFSPPFFPVSPFAFRGEISKNYIETGATIELINGGIAEAFEVAHTDTEYGYRLSFGEVTICYVPDHQEPYGEMKLREDVFEMVKGCDLLIHDAQYNAIDFQSKAHWGHSTYDFAASLAELAEVKKLVLFHHDPSRSDDEISREVKSLKETHPKLEICAAHQGEILYI
ncbi:MAG: MBL fold metallo-hydrolase [Actinomycetota bacterium]|nr:MBL fold metallo-hydrolase [Actinomycetota bacterium]